MNISKSQPCRSKDRWFANHKPLFISCVFEWTLFISWV